MSLRTTTGAVITGPQRVELQEITLPDVSYGTVLVRVEECGVCGSDFQVYDGKAPDRFPMPVGHEFGGIVEEIGAGVSTLDIGDRVAVWVRDGKELGALGLAERCVVPAANCVEVPTASLAAIEPLACAVNAVDLATPPVGAHVVVIGGGYMADLIAALSTTAATVTVAARRQYQLDFATGAGATNTLRLTGNDGDENAALLASEIRAITGGQLAGVAYETTGVADGYNMAAAALRNRGVLCDVGYHQGGKQLLDLGTVNERGLRVVNAHFRPDDESGYNPNIAGFHKAARLLEHGSLAGIERLVTNRRSGLDGVASAFATAAARPYGHLKTVVYDLTLS